jgi:hypothetical protein
MRMAGWYPIRASARLAILPIGRRHHPWRLLSWKINGGQFMRTVAAELNAGMPTSAAALLQLSDSTKRRARQSSAWAEPNCRSYRRTK